MGLRLHGCSPATAGRYRRWTASVGLCKRSRVGIDAGEHPRERGPMIVSKIQIQYLSLTYLLFI